MRRHKVGVGIADILMGFATKRFLQSSADALLTTTRNNRSTHNLCYRQGGKKYADNKVVYGVSSDIVLFYRDHVKMHPEIIVNQAIQHLWLHKEDYASHTE